MTPELESVLAEIETLARRNGRLTRHQARPLLVGLGELLLSGTSQEAEAVKGRLGALPPVVAETWPAAVADEMSMAATEYIRSLDPRYLDHPNYDWAYTLEARERLADRLRAVRFLGIEVDATLLGGIDRADRSIASRRPGWRPNP